MLPRLEPQGLRCHRQKTHHSVLQNLFQALDTPLGILKVWTLRGSQGLILSLTRASSLRNTGFQIRASLNCPTLASTASGKRNLEFDCASPAKLWLYSLQIQGQFQGFGSAFSLTNFLDTRMGLVKGSTIDNYLGLNENKQCASQSFQKSSGLYIHVQSNEKNGGHHSQLGM